MIIKSLKALYSVKPKFCIMKFEFYIQITNQSHSTYQGRIQFRPEDHDLVDLSTVFEKEIYENFNILPNTSSEWFKTEIETKSSFDPNTFRSDIHFRSTIDLELEQPKSMTAAFSMQANATGQCYAFIEINAANQISIRYNDKPVVDVFKPSHSAWTREH